jgi:amino acid transporter
MSDFLDQFSLGGLVPVFAVMLVAGLLIAVVEIFGSASKGLAVSATDGNLPPRLDRVNKGGMATIIVVAQATLGSVLSVLFLLLPSVQSAWWALEATQTMLILAIYVMMYLSVVRLRKTRPDVVRPYRIPGGRVGLYVVTGAGGLACIVAIGLDLIPPSQLQNVSFLTYAGVMLAALTVIVSVPFIVRSRRNPAWKVATGGD